MWYQAAFLTSELEDIFKQVEDRNHAVSANVAQYYKTLKNGGTVNVEQTGRKPLDGDCPICFEDLSESSLADTVYCKAMCGNNIHKECFNQWAQSKSGYEVTCVYCRTKWDDKGDRQENDGQEYLNLAKMVGVSRTRGVSPRVKLTVDTSTYYNGEWWKHSRY